MFLKRNNIIALACKFFARVFFPIVIFAAVMLAAYPAYCDIPQDVSRIFELHAKLVPGMTIEELNKLLGHPAENHALGATPDVTRYAWLHGEMGVEAYEVEGAAYRISITMPCGSDKDLAKGMDAFTRQGYSKYGSMPQSDPRRNEYYWIHGGVRFAFSKYNRTTILSSGTKAY